MSRLRSEENFAARILLEKQEFGGLLHREGLDKTLLQNEAYCSLIFLDFKNEK